MKKLLVTGGSGFWGTGAVPVLKDAGHEVVSLGLRSDGYDLRNESEVLSAVLLERPDVIVHLARTQAPAPAVGKRYRDTLAMGMNVIHAAALSRALLVVAAPAAIYPDFPYDPEGDAKRGLHAMCAAYKAQYKLRFTFIVAPPLYAARRGAVAECVRLCAGAPDGKVSVPGAADDRIALLHAADAAAGLAEVVGYDEGLNLAHLASPEPDATLGDIMRRIKEEAGFSGECVYGPKRAAVPTLPASTNFKWKPVVRLDEGVAECVESVLAHTQTR